MAIGQGAPNPKQINKHDQLMGKTKKKLSSLKNDTEKDNQ